MPSAGWIAGRHDVHVWMRQRADRYTCPSIEMSRREWLPVSGTPAAERHGLHAGQAARAVHEPLPEGPLRVFVPVPFGAKAERHREHPIRRDAGIDRREPGEAPHHQPRVHQQDEREGDFGHDQQVAPPALAPAGPAGPAAFAQTAGHVGPCGLPGRRQAEDDCRGQHREGAEGEHCAVERDSGVAERVGRKQARERAVADGRKRQTRQAAERREHGALDEQLRHDPPAAGADRDAQRDLPLAAGAANERQVRDVRAGDQQHTQDGTEEHEQRRPDVADQDVAQPAERDAELRVRAGIRARQPRGDAVHLAPRRLQAHAAGQPSKDRRIAAVAAALRVLVAGQPHADRLQEIRRVGGVKVGRTPTTVTGWPSRLMLRPTTVGSPPKRVCQSA